MDDRPVLELDARRRCSLAKFGKPEHTRYLAETRDDGTIVLTPAVVMAQAHFDAMVRLAQTRNDRRARSLKAGRSKHMTPDDA